MTTLRSEVQMEFLKAAMAYVSERSWTYYIRGSNYHCTDSSDVTGFRYCASEYSIDDPGIIIEIFFDSDVACFSKCCSHLLSSTDRENKSKYLENTNILCPLISI